MTLLLSFGRKAGKALLQYLDPTSWESWEEGSRELWIFSFWSFCFFLPSLQFVSLFLLYVCSKLHHIFIRFFFCNCFTIPLSLLGGLCHGVVVAWSDGPHTRTFMWSFFMHSTNSMDRELLHRGLPALVAFTGLGAAHQTGSERKGVGDWNRRNFLRMVSEYSGFFFSFLQYRFSFTYYKLRKRRIWNYRETGWAGNRQTGDGKWAAWENWLFSALATPQVVGVIRGEWGCGCGMGDDIGRYPQICT